MTAGGNHHVDLFNSFTKRMPSWDNTVATLIEDLSARGLLDSTMVIALGEFGRTPQINKDAGRDHWSNAMSVLFAGGHTQAGRQLAATTTRVLRRSSGCCRRKTLSRPCMPARHGPEQDVLHARRAAGCIW